jgi:tRNA(Ser,Leu) C12 N-acetylase TAN1
MADDRELLFSKTSRILPGRERRIIMKEWNILVSTHWGQERKSLRFLSQHGEFKSSGFKDLLQGHVENVNLFLDKLELMRQENPNRINSLSQIVPLERTFYFELPDFMEKLKQIVLSYAGRIEDKKFYVRVKRRGHKGEMSSQEIEKEVAGFVIEKLEKAGKDAQVSFGDPDVILVVETIANWAGVTLITREMKEKYPLVKVK